MSVLSTLSSSWELLTSYVSQLTVTTLAIAGSTSLLLFLRWITKKNMKLPPGPYPLPIIGNLLSMRNKAMETLVQDWAVKYGPVFTIYLGPVRTIVVTDIKSTTEALVKQGSDFSGRPFLYSLDKLSQGSKDIANAPYGEFWKFQRKVALQALRHYLSGSQFEERVHEMTQIVVQNIEKEKGAFDIHIHISLAVFNTLHGLCFGDVLTLDDPNFREVIKLFDEIRDMSQDGFLEDLLPPLRLWPSRKFTRALEYIDWFLIYLKKQMDERRDSFNEGAITCLADNIIEVEKNSDMQAEGPKLTKTHTLQILSDVFGAGLDTMRATLDWIFLVLVNYPDIQARMHDEIDTVVGERIAGREHRPKLVYTEAVIFETMRLYPPGPYGIPHETTCDTTIGEYQIPEKTTVLFSLLSTMRDPQLWDDPLTFKPERFLNETQSKIVVPNSCYIPFSMGHRTCPGEGFAKLQMLYVLVGLLQKFTFSFPPGETVALPAVVQGFVNAPPSFNVVIKRR